MELSRRYDYHSLREPFQVYLTAKYPNRSIKTNKTMANDALSLFSWMREEEAWEFIFNRSVSRDKQLNFLADEFLSHRRKPRKDAGGYLRAVNEFREFMDLALMIDAARKRLPRRVDTEAKFEVVQDSLL